MTFRTEPSSYLFSKRICHADARRPDRASCSDVPRGVAMVLTHWRNSRIASQYAVCATSILLCKINWVGSSGG